MARKHKNLEGTDREAESADRSLPDFLSKRKDRDWLPVDGIGVVITLFFVVFILSLYMFLSGAPDQKTVPKTFVEKPAPVQKSAEQKRRQTPKLERPKTGAANQKTLQVQDKSPALAPSVKYSGRDASELAAFYPFNGNADDESGNGNHGTVYGASPAEDRFGNVNSAYRFDGVDDYIDIGHPLVSGNFTISFWLKSNGRQNRFAVPVSQGNMSYKGFNFTFTKGRYNGFCWGTWKEKSVPDPHWGNSDWHTQDFNFPTDINADLTWHHLAVTHTGNTISVYRDGEFQGSTSSFPINYGKFHFNIGRASGNRDFNHRTFNGIIDDIRIYNRSLSEEEILALYKK